MELSLTHIPSMGLVYLSYIWLFFDGFHVAYGIFTYIWVVSLMLFTMVSIGKYTYIRPMGIRNG